MLHTSKADNAKDECKKLKGIAKVAAQVSTFCTTVNSFVNSVDR
jgi:hypothetical protein